MPTLAISEQITNEIMSLEWRVACTCIATIIVNLPFGYFRGGFRRLSFWWFVGIHAPVPFVILIRRFHHLDLTWEMAPFMLGSYLVGQIIGKLIYTRFPFKKAKK